jgi:hypothetical protein
MQCLIAGRHKESKTIVQVAGRFKQLG